MNGVNDAPGNANLPIGDARGWYSRGYIPHFDGSGAIQHVTFHLADSLPKDVVERLATELLALPPEKRDSEKRERIEAWIDSGYGSCVLRMPEIAEVVESTLLQFDGARYRLLAWVVMPNHVHALFQPINGWTMAKIVASWKKFTARKILDYQRSLPGNANLLIGVPSQKSANPEIGAPGDIPRVWHREYWDRYIRDERHLQQAIEYIHQNPVKAGLVGKTEGWAWSSASANRETGVPG